VARTVSIGRWLRSAAIRLTAYLAIAYLTLGVFFYFRQATLLFPAPKTFEKKTPADSGLRFEDLRIAVNARDHLHAWWIPAAPPTDKAILVFHGNGYVLEDMVGHEMANLHQIGANLMLIDYRGFGSSTPIGPNETTVDEDAQASLDYLLRARMIPSDKVWVLGRSIGSGPATYVAMNNRRLGGLILESPFTSIDDAAAGFWYYRIYPAALMLRTHFDNLTKIKSVKAPVLIVSGNADTLTPTWMAGKLFAQAHQPKEIYIVPGAGHDDLLILGGVALEQELRRFVLEEH
jgi:pimeloyl-ACP methyl ester carboxylesterase